MEYTKLTSIETVRDHLKKIIVDEVFVTCEKEKIISKKATESRWIFDFRRVLLKAPALNTISELFWNEFVGKEKFQIGGLEVAAIPFIAGVVMKSFEKQKPINGFFIRKSRKKDGLTKMIEGEITEERIILIDDILNSGKTFIRQIEILERLGKKVDTIFVLLRFRDLSYYTYFYERNIKIVSLFELNDFRDVLPVKTIVNFEEKLIPMPFTTKWYFKSENPGYQYVAPKSSPILDEKNVYFGSDGGNFWALCQDTGEVVWNYKVHWSVEGKGIFSSPTIHKDTIYFGAYDGNVYALDKNTGKKKWMFMEADWVGSSPVVAPDLRLLFVGEEFGIWNKKGGIVALDLKTGRKKWSYREMPEFTHSSPLYIKERRAVVIGSNNGMVYCFDAKNGGIRWTFATNGEVKSSFTYDAKRDRIYFGSFDCGLYVIDAKTGEQIFRSESEYGIYSTPIIFKQTLIYTSLDKKVYCIDLDTFKRLWLFTSNGRIFSNPVIIEGKVYVGSNDARFYEIDPETGKNTAFFQAVERIVNTPAYNPKTKRFFLPTYANEIYCLERGI